MSPSGKVTSPTNHESEGNADDMTIYRSVITGTCTCKLANVLRQDKQFLWLLSCSVLNALHTFEGGGQILFRGFNLI